MKINDKILTMAISEAVIMGTMEEGLEWVPLEIISLTKKMEYHENLIRGRTVQEENQSVRELMARAEKIKAKISSLKAQDCTKFYTEFTVSYQSYPSYWSKVTTLNKSDIKLIIDFSNETIEVKWKIGRWSDGISVSKKCQCIEVDSKYYLLPALIITGPIIRDPNSIKRFEYHYGPEEINQ